MNLGDTFVPVGTSGRASHLHVVVSDQTEAGEVAVVNLTSKRADSDTCCELGDGDHPFVQHETVVAYKFGKLVSVAGLAQGINARVLKPHDSLQPAILERIQYGALACEETPGKVAAAIRETLGLPPGT